MNFIQQVLDHTKALESPTSFWKWSAITTIGAILRDSTKLKSAYGDIYPNLYVLFIANSGERKDPPIMLCEELLLKVSNTKIVSGRATGEALMDRLQTTVSNPRTGKRDIKGSSGIMIAGELSAGLVASDSLIKVLTALYDFKPNPFEDLRRTRENVTLERIVFSLLGGTNITMSKDIITTVAITGGLLARSLIVVPNEYRPGAVGLKFDKEKHEKERNDCVESLKKLALLNGEWQLTSDAYEYFEKWYLPFRERNKGRHDPIGIYARIHSTIHKVAIIYAANDHSFPDIKKIHYEEAIFDCLSLLPNYQSFYMANGKSPLQEQGAIVLQELISAKDFRISRKKLLMNHLMDLDIDILDKIIQKLQLIGYINEVHYKNESHYQLTEVGIANLVTSTTEEIAS
jgi:hypothetical protein